MNVLVLAAHPDDETLGCGATIARLSDEGHKIRLLTFTDGVGARNSAAENRNNKLDAVCEVLGINEHHSTDYPDNRLDTVPLLDVCKFIENNVDYDPDLIFTHHPDCLNLDHSIIYRATITAFRPQEGMKTKILSYYIPSSTDYNPIANFNENVYYDVTKCYSRKMKALEIYDDEIRPYPHSRSYENILNLMKVAGSKVGIEYAESFQLIREIT